MPEIEHSGFDQPSAEDFRAVLTALAATATVIGWFAENKPNYAI
jgi:hypothetical protein